VLYLVTFSDGSQGVFTFEQIDAIFRLDPDVIVSYEVYEPEPEPEPTPTDEELIYANWQRTGGTGSFAYWQSIGSPLYYTPPPEPEPTPEELIYANWLRTGGTGTFAEWQALGSPLYYTPPPEPEPEPPPEEVPTVYYGSIIEKELEYNEARGIIPVASVPQNKRGLFHVIARNDMSTSQPIGIYWFINDPDGLVVEEYSDWKWGTLGPGQTHEFIGGRFTFSKIGRYGAWVDLLMGSKDNPVIIFSARYIGNLWTVVSLVPEYKGSIAKKELEYNGDRKPIPVY